LLQSLRCCPPYNEKASEAIGATSGIPVIGIGGSAGALESFKNFLTAMPADSGAALVIIIRHLAPAHSSMLVEQLAQHTRMKVHEIREAMPVEPDCVYVIPPSKYVALRDGILYLSEPVMEHRIRMPIDFFYRSLAEDRQVSVMSCSKQSLRMQGFTVASRQPVQLPWILRFFREEKRGCHLQATPNASFVATRNRCLQ
jgi:chemotaxis response regulator CheB